MSARAWTEVQLAVGGALRLAIGDRRGLGFFDTSIDGFWRSFRAAIICYPLYLALVGFRVTGAEWHQAGVATILLVETIGYVISWVAFPLLILSTARWFGREDRFLTFMVVYNWSQIPQIVLLAIVGLDAFSGLLPAASAGSVEVIATIATLVYEWYITRVALRASGAQALFVVILDIVLGSALANIAKGLY